MIVFQHKFRRVTCYLPVFFAIEMGEQTGKPRVEDARRTHQKNRQRRQFNPAVVTKSTAHTAPTPGFEKTVFTFDQADSAARFEECREALARYVGATYKYGGGMAQRAIQDLTAPSFTDPPTIDPNASMWDKMNGNLRQSRP